jgi:hypothetical protein
VAEKTVAQKGHIKAGARIAVIEPVPGLVESLGLPDVRFVRSGAADLVVLFARTRARLEARMPQAARRLAPGAALWVFFRKGAKQAGLDMNRDTVWALADRLGLRPLGLVAVDEAWSAFRLRGAATGEPKAPSAVPAGGPRR